MVSGIYQITNTVTGDCYIGFSKNIPQRWKLHLSEMRGVAKGTRHPEQYISCNRNVLYSCFEHGLDSFSFEVLEECEERYLRQKESEWIGRLQPSFNLKV